MGSFIGRLENVLATACMSFINTGVSIKKGVLSISEEVSYGMYEIYSLEGFEKFSKVTIASLRALSLIPSMRGVFDPCIKTLEGQKDLIYGTLLFSSTADFVYQYENNNGETHYRWQWPKVAIRDQQGSYLGQEIDWVKILYGIGNIFETGKFLQKYKVCNFPLCSQLANQFGSIQLFAFRGHNLVVKDIPVLNCWCDKPKDFFVFFASSYSAYKCVKNPNFWSVGNLVKLGGNIGKMVLISGADYMLRQNNLVLLSIIDVATQTFSLISLELRRREARQKRFNNPC